MPPEDDAAARCGAARVVMDGATAACSSSSCAPRAVRAAAARSCERRPRRRRRRAVAARRPLDLELFNGTRRLRPDGREYVIASIGGRRRGRPRRGPTSSPTDVRLRGDRSRPGFTWSENSHDNRLTPWRNDPVSDPPGEAVFLRDEETGSSGRRRRCPPAAARPTSSATGRATASTSTRATGSHRAAAVRAARRAGEGVPAALRNDSGARAALGDALRRVGARREPFATRLHVVTEPRAGDRRAPGVATPSARSSPTAWRSSTCSGRGADASPATAPSSSAATARSRAPAALARDAPVRPHRRRRSIPAARFQVRHAQARRERDRDRPARRGADATRRALRRSATARRRGVGARCATCARSGTAARHGRRCGRPIHRWT